MITTDERDAAGVADMAVGFMVRASIYPDSVLNMVVEYLNTLRTTAASPEDRLIRAMINYMEECKDDAYLNEVFAPTEVSGPTKIFQQLAETRNDDQSIEGCDR